MISVTNFLYINLLISAVLLTLESFVGREVTAIIWTITFMGYALFQCYKVNKEYVR